VGLSNPGVDAFAEEMTSLGALAAARKHGKVVMASIFGGTEDEFAEVASRIAPYADWLELNLSCPHASGYGATIGTKPDLVESVVRAVRSATGLPIFAKIVPSVGLAGMIARRAVEAGADGITAVNTVGPLAFSDASGNALLNNVLGGCLEAQSGTSPSSASPRSGPPCTAQ
jgi:dihydroorotate dehydrogenase (NAD+) catalytic subunit